MLGSDVELTTGKVTALPTREALLPVLSVIAAAQELGLPLSRMSDELSSWFTASDRLQNFTVDISKMLVSDWQVVPNKALNELGLQTLRINNVMPLTV